MRKKKNTQPLEALIAAQDLQINFMRNEIEGLRRTTITIKKAMNAPLVLWESHWFDGLEPHEQTQINKSADLIARTLRPPQQPLVITNTTPITVTQPKRKREVTTNSSARWKKSEDAILRKMKKAGKTNNEIATTLGRSEKAIMNRYTILKAGK